MAEFSKQWCDLYDPKRIPDFDIEAIAKDMYRDRYYPIVCEGFGFDCIHKDAHGVVWLNYPSQDKTVDIWKRYKTVMAEQKILLEKKS
jgi:hypothetical protein